MLKYVNTLVGFSEFPDEISLLINMLRSGLLLTDETERQMLLEELEETFTTDEDYLKEHEDDEEIRQLIKKTINEANEDFKDMNKDSKKTLQ